MFLYLNLFYKRVNSSILGASIVARTKRVRTTRIIGLGFILSVMVLLIALTILSVFISWLSAYKFCWVIVGFDSIGFSMIGFSVIGFSVLSFIIISFGIIGFSIIGFGF